MNELNLHLNKVDGFIKTQNGLGLSNELSITDLITFSLKPKASQSIINKINQLNKLNNQIKNRDVEPIVFNKIPQYSDVILNRFKCIQSILDQKYYDAFKYLTESINSFVKIFELWSSNLLWKLSLDLRLLAELLTKEEKDIDGGGSSGGSGNKIDYYEEASRTLLSKCFQVCNADRTSVISESKKNASLGVVNQLFHIYFKINNLKLCKNLINTINSTGFPPLESYPLSQLITYRFFNGRLSVFNGDYKKAQQDLLYSFNKCPRSSFKNKRLILLFLVPMQLEQWKFPKRSLLEKYKLNQFIDLVEAIKVGNIRQFNECLSTHQNFFISKGIYLILEKLKIICYRNLFKKVCLIHSGQRIPIGNFLSALKWMENDSIDIDETQCVLSNLIHGGYLKGYISHKVALVVSPTNPFPQLLNN